MNTIPSSSAITLVIRNCYDSGNVAYIRFALATLAVVLERLGRLEPAATIAGFALNPLSASTSREHDGLG